MSENVQLLEEENVLPVDEARYSVIDGRTREIKMTEGEKFLGVETDHNSERRYFKCPKIVGDNINLALCQMYVGYLGASDKAGEKLLNEEAGRYHCDDVIEDGDYIYFSWKLSGNVFKRKGFVAFNIYAVSNDGEEAESVWNTTLAVGTVKMTIPKGKNALELYPDVINQLFERLLALEAKLGTGGGTSFSGSAADITYDNAKSKLDADNAQDALDKLQEEIVNLEAEIPTKVSQLQNDMNFAKPSDMPTITQEAGESETLIMSQKAVTQLVNDALGNQSEYETVDSVDKMTDTSKSYILSTTGTVWAYGETEPRPNFTNLATTFEADKRLNSSGTLSDETGATTVEDYIDFIVGDVVRVKGFGELKYYNVSLYNASKTVTDSSKPTAWSDGKTYVYDNETKVATLTNVTLTNARYLRASGILTGTTQDVIITKNQEITYSMGYGWYDTGMSGESASSGGNYVDLLVKVNQNTSDISELEKQVANLSSGSESLTIPTFLESAVNEAITKIKALQVGRNCITFPFFSDNHQRNGYVGLLIAYIMKECNIPYCFYGGDSISSGYIDSEATMIAQDKAFDTIMKYIPNGRFCRAVGNHDGYWAVSSSEKYTYTREQVYELFLREESVAQNKHFGDDGTYYFVDDLASKVRFIVMNTNGGSVDSTQISWLQNTALSFNESGWGVVFISHQPISNHYHALISNAQEVRTIVKNYINGPSTNKADVIGWYRGHIHRDRIWTGIATNTSDDTQGDSMGFTQVTITSDHTSIAYDDSTKHTVANDDKSHAIDFVTINKSTRQVNITRLGIGNDRSYTY